MWGSFKSAKEKQWPLMWGSFKSEEEKNAKIFVKETDWRRKWRKRMTFNVREF